MAENIKKRWIEERKAKKLEGRKPLLPPAKTKNGKWVRFYVLIGITALILLAAIIGPHFVPYDPIETQFDQALQAPSAEHIFGTDNLGRDVFSRVVAGAGTSFSLSFIIVLIISTLGTTLGIISGFFGGKLDVLIMRFTEVLLAFPDTVFAIAVVGMMGPGLLNTVLALSVIWWTRYARVTRGLASTLRNKEFVTQARFSGAKTGKVLRSYILPNILPQVIIMATLDIGNMMLSLASLSFLGLASQPPTPEWGYMLYEGKQYLQTAPWMIWFPGLILFVTVIVFNLLGDSVRDVLDPKDK